ncbi:glycosyltransferase family 2 protein [Acuticoccus sp. I52.16.1]|uniref:glycosyltransferase family 2 protein n=1 Tax=Acuticoccus sp. I52.16.1 TaxID=2928472 RepID=UPI001FD37624|nr:glycosyltransferase family 2 protein [Acuticoccus sp. I52.16.1]UOM34192.1 glycosyltransferase [Acuticoccus sp. I52.16.1]
MLPEPLDITAELPFETGFRMERAAADLPGVSIVIPVYNAGPFLERTIRSLLMNDLAGCELILMDGGSTDGTMDVVGYYRDHFAVVVSERDSGQSDAINKGMARAKKPILTWLNGDDLILPNRLNVVREAFRDRPGTKVVVGNAYLTDLDLTPIHRFNFAPERLTFGRLLNYSMNHLVQPSVFFAREAWRACGPVKEDLHYAMDADLFLAMAGRYTFEHVPVDVAYSVYHSECKTLKKRGESLAELAMVQARHGGFKEAEITLGQLVALYNGAKARAETLEETAGPGSDVALLHRRLNAMARERRRARDQLLAATTDSGA